MTTPNGAPVNIDDACKIIAKEEGVLASLAEGGSLSTIYGVPEVKLID